MIAIRLIMLLYTLLVSACGGGGASAPQSSSRPPVKMIVQNGTQAMPGFNASANFPRDDADPAASAAEQARAPGDVILIMAPIRDTAFTQLDAWLAAARQHPSIRWVYVFDEMCWYGNLDGCQHADEISAAARRVRAAGLQSVVSIDTGIILSPAFEKVDLGAFDVILVVDYPDAYINQDARGCALSVNRLTNLLACSITKLRAKGFAGEVGYVYQAFGIAPDGTPLTDQLAAALEADLKAQRETIAAAPALGATWIVAFGLFPYENLTAPLYAGKGTAIEPLVLP